MAEAALSTAEANTRRSLLTGNALPIAIFLVFALVPLLATFKAEAYVLSLVTRVMIFAIAALALDLLIGLVDTLGRSFAVDIMRLFLAPSPARTVGPAIASMLIYLLMAVVLYVRPAGLFPAKGR